MALIACPECGKQVSELAVACPNCGFGVREYTESITDNRDMSWICPKCGHIDFKGGTCKYCNITLQKNKCLDE